MFTRADYIRQFRQDNPSLSSWSDDDILDQYAENLADQIVEHPALAEHVKARRIADTSLLKETGSAIAAGTDKFQEKLYDATALAGRLIGSESIERWGREGADRNAEEGSEFEPIVSTFQSVRSPHDFAYWLANIVGSNAPQMAGTAAAAAVAALAAPEAAVGAGAAGAASLGVRALSLLPGLAAKGGGISTKALAALGASSAMGFTQMQNFGELEKLGGDHVVPLAVANGLLGSVLEAAGPASLMAKLVSGGMRRETAEAVAKDLLLKAAPGPAVNAALAAAKGGSTEMLTEMAQEALTIATEVASNRNNPDFKLTEEDIRSRIFNSGVAGFVLGGFGGGLVETLSQPGRSDPVAAPRPKPPAQAQVSLDPIIPPLPAPATVPQAAAITTPAAPAAPLPAVAPVAQVSAPALASPATQAQLVQLGVPTAEAMTFPEADAQRVIAEAAAQAQQRAAQAQAQSSAQFAAQRQAEAANAATMEAQAERAAIQQARDRQIAAQQAQAAQVQQLRAQQAAARNLGQSESIQVKTGGIVSALQSQAPDVVPAAVQPGAKIFDIIQQAKANADQAATALMKPQKVVPVSTPAAVSPIAETPAPVSSPVPAAPAPVTPVSPEVTPTHGLPGLKDLSVRRFLPSSEVSSLKAAAAGDPRKPTDRFFAFERPDGMVEIRKASATGGLAVRDNMGATPRSIAAAVNASLSGRGKISESMVRNILSGKSGTYAAEVLSEATRQGYTKSGERISAEKLIESGFRWIGTIEAPKDSKQIHLQVVSRDEFDAAIARPENPGRAAGVVGTSVSEAVLQRLAERISNEAEFQKLTALPNEGLEGERTKAWRGKFQEALQAGSPEERAAFAKLTPQTSRERVEAAFGEASRRRGSLPAPIAAPVPTPAPAVNNPVSPVVTAPVVAPDGETVPAAFRLDPDTAALAVEKLGADRIAELVESKGEKFTKFADAILKVVFAKDSVAMDAINRMSPVERKLVHAALRGDLAAALDAQHDEILIDERTLKRQPADQDYGLDDNEAVTQFNLAYREALARGAAIKVSEAKKALKSGGQYDPTLKEIHLTMKNVVNPSREDLLNLLHEVVHHVTEGKPEWVRRALQDTFARLPSGAKAFYHHPDADPRVASGENISGLADEVFLLEQAVEHATISGVERSYAEGVIPAVWRTIKDYLLQGAMYLQKLLLGEQHVGGAVAKKWVENVATQLLAGDRVALSGFLGNFSRPVLPKTTEFAGMLSKSDVRQSVRGPVDAVLKSIMQEGLAAKIDAQDELAEIDPVLYRTVPNARKEASEQVAAGIRQAISNAKIHVAVANQLHRTYRALYARAQKLETPLTKEQILARRRDGAAVPDALTFESFMSLHGLSDPIEARDEAIAEINALLEQHTGEKVKEPIFNPETLIDELGATEKGIAEKNLIAETSRHAAKAAARVGAARRLIVSLGDRGEKSRAEIQAITKSLNDYKATERAAVQSIVANLDDLTRKVLPKSERLSEEAGMTRAIVDQLDATELYDTDLAQKVVDRLDVPNLPLASIFKALFALEAEREIDLASAKPSDVRQLVLDEVQMNGDSALARLVEVGEGPDAKVAGTALLTAILSFVKKEAAIADTIRVQLSTASDRADRINEIRTVLNETSESKLTEIRERVKTDLKRAGNRAIYNWLKKRDDLLRDQRRLANAEQALSILRVSSPVLEQAQARASSRLEVTANWIFTPGAAILNPTDPNWSSREVFDRPYILNVARDKFATSEEIRTVLRNQAAWMAAQEAKSDFVPDETYNAVKLQRARLLEAAVDKELALHAGLKNGAFHALGEMVTRTGTPAGKLIARRINRFESIKRTELAPGTKLGKKFETAAENFFRAANVTPDWAHIAMYNQALDYLGSERLLDEKSAFANLRAQFRENPLTADVVKEQATWDKFVEWMRATAENNIHQGEVSVGTGNRVLDDDIQRMDPKTRENRAALRMPIERGLKGYTVGRGLNSAVRAAIGAIADRGIVEGDGPASIFADAALKLQTAPSELRDSLKSFFTGELRSVFLDPLIRNQKATLPSPDRPDGLRVALDPGIAREAWETADGDLLSFAEAVYRKLGVDGTAEGLTRYQGAVLKFVEGRLKALIRDIPSASDEAGTAPKGLPHVAMDARKGEDYPWEWLDYHQFSVEDNLAHVNTIAANAAFGRNLEGVRGDFARLLWDLRQLKNQMPGKPDARKALKAKNPKRYAMLEDAARQYNKYKGGALEEFIRNEFEPERGATGDMGLALEIYGVVITGMLTGVKTALKDLASLTHPMQLEKSVGPATLGTTAAAHGYAAKYGMAAVMNSLFGTDLLRNDPLVKMYEAATGGDVARSLTYKDLATGTRGKGNVFEKSTFGKVQRGLRIFRNVISNGRVGFNQGAAGPALRANLFPFATQVQVYAGTSAYMRRAADLALRIAKFYRENPERTGTSVTARDLGIFDSIGFNNLRAILMDYGISIEALGEKLVKAKDPKLDEILSPTAVQGIAAMVYDKLLLEGGPNTRPTFMRGSKFARANSALIGWSFAKTAALADLVRDPERNANVKTVLNGATVMFLGLLPAALAGSLMMDLYDEEVIKKKSNLRSFTSGMSPEDAAKAFLERTVNMGALGLPGEVLNALVNQQDGAGTRNLSVDQRIVWVNSIIQMKDAISNLIAVGGPENANYANVWRPMISALGAGGVLQNVQLLNSVLGEPDAALFDDEAKVTARINVQNFLRSAGRELQMEVAKSGAQALPNPATPWITNMLLAALANDPEAFQEAYRGAVIASRDVPGVTDPMQYVKERFAGRHPLKTVFRTTPSRQEVMQLLAAMPEEGRRSVADALRLVNAYGGGLGIAPYFGSEGQNARDLLQMQARNLGIPASGASISEIRAALAARRNSDSF